MDLVNKIVDWEDGSMSTADEVSFFQELVNTGMAWRLHGLYGRRAASLIAEGKVFLHA